MNVGVIGEVERLDDGGGRLPIAVALNVKFAARAAKSVQGVSPGSVPVFRINLTGELEARTGRHSQFRRPVLAAAGGLVDRVHH